MRMTERRDGTIRIEAIGQRDNWLENMQIWGSDGWCRDVREGDEGCLATRESVSPDTMRQGGATEINASLIDDRDGIPGNSNSSIKRLHEWRGTTQDIARYAMGWRRVISISPRPRGVGYIVILSKDLAPEEA